jgi:hypothetical protein
MVPQLFQPSRLEYIANFVGTREVRRSGMTKIRSIWGRVKHQVAELITFGAGYLEKKKPS